MFVSPYPPKIVLQHLEQVLKAQKYQVNSSLEFACMGLRNFDYYLGLLHNHLNH